MTLVDGLEPSNLQSKIFLTKGISVVYAVVRAGGRQEKVSVGTIVTLDRIKADANGNISMAAVLLVDGDKVTIDAAELAKVKVTAKVLGDLRGPKIIIQKYKEEESNG